MSEQKQFGQFVGMVVQNLPELTTGNMQSWIGNPKGLQAILAKLVEDRFTNNHDGTITFTLPPTAGTTGEQWIARLEKAGKRLSDEAKFLLRSESFKPTRGMAYQVTVLKGELFSDENRITRKIRAEAKKRKLSDLPAEAACLIREFFSDEEIKAMGLWYLVVMHEPIKGSGGGPGLLGILRLGVGRWLHAVWDDLDRRWLRETGFVFGSASCPQS